MNSRDNFYPKRTRERALHREPVRRITSGRLTSVLQMFLVVTLISGWLYLCYSTGLYVREAMVCSSIIAAIACFKAAESEGKYHNHK